MCCMRTLQEDNRASSFMTQVFRTPLHDNAIKTWAPSCRKRQRLNMSSGECMSYARQPGQSSSSWSTQVLSVCVFFQMTMCVACTCVLTRQTCSRGNLVQNWRLLNPDALHKCQQPVFLDKAGWQEGCSQRVGTSQSDGRSRTSCGSLHICLTRPSAAC